MLVVWNMLVPISIMSILTVVAPTVQEPVTDVFLDGRTAVEEDWAEITAVFCRICSWSGGFVALKGI
jgi:hypothetical protein